MTRRRPRSSAATALRVIKGALLATLIALAVLSGMREAMASPSSADSRPESLDEAYSRVVERAMADHRCSYDGAPDPGPASALVRTVDGDVQVVSFEKGWDVYNGKRPGSLISVCLDEPSADGAVLRAAPRA